MHRFRKGISPRKSRNPVSCEMRKPPPCNRVRESIGNGLQLYSWPRVRSQYDRPNSLKNSGGVVSLPSLFHSTAFLTKSPRPEMFFINCSARPCRSLKYWRSLYVNQTFPLVSSRARAFNGEVDRSLLSLLDWKRLHHYASTVRTILPLLWDFPASISCASFT